MKILKVSAIRKLHALLFFKTSNFLEKKNLFEILYQTRFSDSFQIIPYP